MTQAIYKKYLLSVLLLISAFNYVDRLALGLLLQDIKIDLSLTDTQLGFMSGIAFALFYAVMGIPIARWADRGNRVTIISLTTAVWSVAVALCGMAGSFVHLLLIRVGVAVGEAGCVPPAHSLMAEYFPRAERPKAVAMYNLALPLSVVIGYFGGGWLNELYGWRMTFVLLGLPGIALALLARFTLREPRVSLKAPEDCSDPAQISASTSHLLPQPSIREVCETLWANITFRHLLFAYAVALFFGSGIGQWNASFFIRSYGIKSGELGTWFALISGIGGLLGIWLGGVLASRYATSNERLQLRYMTVTYIVCFVIHVCKYLSPNMYLAFGLMALSAIAGGGAIAPLFATIQTLVPDRMRAMSVAILFLVANLIGMGFGPLAAGALSDTLRVFVGEESLRYSLLILCPGTLWCAWHLWRASSTVTADVELAQRAASRAAVEPEAKASSATMGRYEHALPGRRS